MEKNNCLRCNFRHKDNGNCTAVGGFCTAVPAAHCPLLRQYLDTGMTPEKIDMDHEAAETLRQLCRGCDLDRLEKLAEADKDGRVVVLPCKIGDVLYRASPSGVVVHRVANVMYRGLTSRWYIDTIPNLPYASEELGKTTFLTSEEAEKALEAMKDG